MTYLCFTYELKRKGGGGGSDAGLIINEQLINIKHKKNTELSNSPKTTRTTT